MSIYRGCTASLERWLGLPSRADSSFRRESLWDNRPGRDQRRGRHLPPDYSCRARRPSRQSLRAASCPSTAQRRLSSPANGCRSSEPIWPAVLQPGQATSQRRSAEPASRLTENRRTFWFVGPARPIPRCDLWRRRRPVEQRRVSYYARRDARRDPCGLDRSGAVIGCGDLHLESCRFGRYTADRGPEGRRTSGCACHAQARYAKTGPTDSEGSRSNPAKEPVNSDRGHPASRDPIRHVQEGRPAVQLGRYPGARWQLGNYPATGCAHQRSPGDRVQFQLQG